MPTLRFQNFMVLIIFSEKKWWIIWICPYPYLKNWWICMVGLRKYFSICRVSIYLYRVQRRMPKLADFTWRYQPQKIRKLKCLCVQLHSLLRHMREFWKHIFMLNLGLRQIKFYGLPIEDLITQIRPDENAI